MRHVEIGRRSRNGRLYVLEVQATRRYDWDPPAKSYHGKVDLDRYLDGHTLTKFGKERDSRRQNFYGAQRKAKESISTESFDSLDETARFVGDILRRAWWQRRYPICAVTLKPGYGARRASAKGRYTIVLPKRMRTEWTVLHELIHITVSKPHAGHGRLYAARFLEIIRWHFGDETAQELKEAYRDHNVKWHPRRSPRRTTIRASLSTTS